MAKQNESLVNYEGEAGADQVRIRVSEIADSHTKTITREQWEELTKPVEPPPGPAFPPPEEALAAFKTNTRQAALYFCDTPLWSEPSSLLIAQLNYDGPWVFRELARQFAGDQEMVDKCSKHAAKIVKRAKEYFLTPRPPRRPHGQGAPGYYNYNRGLADAAGDGDDADALRAAQLCACCSAYSAVWADTIPGWWDRWDTNMLSREHALCVSSHINVLPWPHTDPYRPDDDDETRRKHLIKRMQEMVLPIVDRWVGLDFNDWSSVANPDEAWAPFMMALHARAMIQFRDSQLEPSLDKQINTGLNNLADIIIKHAWRQHEGVEGVLLKPRVEKDEKPRPDLGMLVFNLLADVAVNRKDKRAADYASRLLVNSRHGFGIQIKQFNQLQMLTYLGLRKFGWRLP